MTALCGHGRRLCHICALRQQGAAHDYANDSILRKTFFGLCSRFTNEKSLRDEHAGFSWLC
jgi:hypothetical protein